MPPGKQTKEVKIEFKMEVNKMVSAMEQVQKSFKESTQNIDKMSDSFKNMETKLHLVNMKMADMAKNISAMTQTNMVMSKDIKQSFSEWGTLLNDNNQKITSAINKMVQMNKSIADQRAELAKKRAENDKSNESMNVTFMRLKMLNLGFNFFRNHIQDAVKDIKELDSRVKTIATITGESTRFIEDNIKRLSIQSGISIDKIGAALQDAANEGNSLTQSMEKINAAVLISQKSAISFENAIARVDDISDMFGKRADYVSATMLHLNISSERAMKVFGRLGREVVEAGIGFEDAAAMMSVLANKAGLSESALQVAMRSMLNGIQRLGKEGGAYFMKDILPNWNKLEDTQKRIIEQQLGLDKNNFIIDKLGKFYGEAHKKAEEVVRDQDKIIAQSKMNPDTFVKRMNEAWVHFISIIKNVSSELTLAMGLLNKFVDLLKWVDRQTRMKAIYDNIDAIREANDTILDLDKAIATVKSQLNKKNENGVVVLEEEERKQANINGMMERRKKLMDQIAIYKGELPSSFFPKNNSSSGKSIISDGMAGIRGLGTFNLDKGTMMSDKQSTKMANEELEKRRAGIEAQYTSTYDNEGKLNALIEKKKNLQQLYNDLQVQSAKIANDHSTEAETYTKKWSEAMRRVYVDIGKTSNKISDMTNSNSEKTEKSNARIAIQVQTDLSKEIELQRTSLKNKYEHHELSYSEYQLELDSLELETESIDKQIKKKEILEKINNDQKNAYQASADAIAKLNASFSKEDMTARSRQMKEDLETSKLSFRLAHDRNMTRTEEIGLLKKELEIKQQIAVETGVKLDSSITNEQRIHSIRMRHAAELKASREEEIRQIQEKGYVDANAFSAERAQITARMGDQINAIQAVMAAEIALKDVTEKRRADEQAAADAFAQGLNNVMNTALEKVIKNTGDLSHAWKKFAQDFLVTIAQMIAKQIMFNMLTDMGFMSGKGIFSNALRKVFGFSSGTGVGGVPGYASGTGMMGTDTVPAMLTPGEIVLDRNASDVFRGMAASGGGMGGITVIIQSNPSLLGNREELIRLDTALNNPIVRTSSDRRRI